MRVHGGVVVDVGLTGLNCRGSSRFYGARHICKVNRILIVQHHLAPRRQARKVLRNDQSRSSSAGYQHIQRSVCISLFHHS